MIKLLPAAQWTQRADLAELIAALGAGNTRYVGGAVRDTLLGAEVKDVDMATLLRPDDVMERITSAGFKAIPTGIEHGTVTAVLPMGPVEITTLRHDVSTDGRRAIVAFADDWAEDAARRDFTINALYADPVTLEVFDYFGGLDDVSARRVRFIGDARARIAEDHLRILRYFRFQARFGRQEVDLMSEMACADMAAMLKALSRERIGMEVMNLLALPNPAPIVARMAELGVLGVVLPEGDAAGLAQLVDEEARQGVAPDALRRLAALLPADVAVTDGVAARFRLSGAQKKRLGCAAGREIPLPIGEGLGVGERGEAERPLSRGGPPPPNLPLKGEELSARTLAYRFGVEQALDRLLLMGADIAPLHGWSIPKFPLKGGDIVARGVSAGPEVARILRKVEDRWVAEGFPDAARVWEILGEALA